MRCQNPLCDFSPPHKPPCVTQDGPMYFAESCADVAVRAALLVELDGLRASSRLRPDDQRLKGDVAIVKNQLQAARGAKGE